MKKRTIWIALLAIVFPALGGFFGDMKPLVLGQEPGQEKSLQIQQAEAIGISSPIPDPKFNFTYSDGEKPWVGRIRRNPVEAKIYFPIWKRTFQAFNSMDDEYFNSHIFVVGISAKDFDKDGKVEKRFSIRNR